MELSSSDTSSSVIHFMSTLISYQHAYFTLKREGNVLSREPSSLSAFGTLSIASNNELKAFGLMKGKLFRKKDIIIIKGCLREP